MVYPIVEMIDVGRDPAHGHALPAGQEQTGLAMIEEDPLLRIEELHLVGDHGRNQVGIAPVQIPGHLDERHPIPPRTNHADL